MSQACFLFNFYNISSDSNVYASTLNTTECRDYDDSRLSAIESNYTND